jgi:two-component system, OmpR family, alkaline phosphatase synthesis response regulator PhoP
MAARILIVEDNIDLLTILEEVMSTDFDVRTAQNGEDAIEIARAFEPDLVLLDLQLPGIDGIETGRIIKSEADDRFVPILVLTALADIAEKTAIVETGCCDAWMAKPAPLLTIRAKVNELLYSHSELT